MGLMLGNGGALRSGPETRVRDLAFAAFRIAVASYWLGQQHWKLPPDFGLYQPRGLMFAFEQGIEYPTVDLFATFLRTVVVPNFHLFGWLLLIGEVILGLSMLLGLFTKAGALMGSIQAVILLISQASTPEGPWIYIAILVSTLAVLLLPTNRQLSLDRILAPKLVKLAARGRTWARLGLALM